MNWEKLNPWNWFKHEEPQRQAGQGNVPILKDANPVATGSPAGNSVAQLQQEVNKLFDTAYRGFGVPSTSFWESDSSFRPSLNISGDGDKYLVTIEAPGMEQQDFSIELRDDVLTIRGNKQEEREEKQQHYYRIERRYGAFQRVLALPQDAISDGIKASMKDGVLSIHIPRQETDDSNVRKIAINS